MGLISDPSTSIADFSKAVISLWFRVPQASINAAVAEYNAAVNGPSGSYYPPLTGSIPLLMFGWQGMGSAQTGPDTYTPFDIAPSYIGLVAAPADFPDWNNSAGVSLYARLQYNSGGTQPYSGLTTPIMPDSFEVGASNWIDQTTGAFGGSYAEQPQQIAVSADQWHHLLISLDLTSGSSISLPPGGGVSVDVASQFFWAFDGVNYSGPYVGPHSAQCLAGSGGANEIVSLWSGQQIYSGSTFIATVECAGGTLPVIGYPFGIPASEPNASAIKRIEMAEFQMYTGVTLDTSVEANRRAFLDADGKPVNPRFDALTGGGSPVPGTPPDLFSKLPEVALARSSGAWIGGKNLGTATTHFAKTGTIKPFTPSPQLGK